MSRIILSLAFISLSTGLWAKAPEKAKAPKKVKALKAPKVEFQTTKGSFVIQLNAEKAPNTVKNFLKYVKNKHYEGTVFHRVISNFMIQGGGMTKDMVEKKTLAPIDNEANNGLKNNNYTVAMARTMDPHSASAQFFINVKDNDFLNFRRKDIRGWGYCVFGKVIKGFKTVEAIRQVKTGTKGHHRDVPLEAVTIKKVRLLRK